MNFKNSCMPPCVGGEFPSRTRSAGIHQMWGKGSESQRRLWRCTPTAFWMLSPALLCGVSQWYPTCLRAVLTPGACIFPILLYTSATSISSWLSGLWVCSKLWVCIPRSVAHIQTKVKRWLHQQVGKANRPLRLHWKQAQVVRWAQSQHFQTQPSQKTKRGQHSFTSQRAEILCPPQPEFATA